MTESFFTEDTVALKADPSFTAVVQSTWRDVDSGGFSRSEDLIPHDGVSKDIVMQCLREGQVPPNHVVVKFIYPDSGATLVHERDLILKDRTTMVGDVVKRKSSDAQSGMVIKTSMTCTLEPIYNGLPYHGSGPWDYLPQDNLLKVPVEDIQFLDYEPGDRIIYNDWMGEIVDVYEDVSVRLGNGSVVKVEDPDALEIPDCIYRDDLAPRPSLIAALKKGRQRRKGIHAVNSKDENTEPPQSFYPGQSILTTKANLRLGHWVIGSYTPSEPPRGVVVDVRVSSLRMEWICTKLYDKERENMDMPPITLEFPELEEIKVFNKTNLASTVNGASSQYGSRHGNDVSAGDIVKFRDVSGAAVKYSEQSPDRSKTGVFRRIPRLITQGFDMNTFQVKETDTRALIQWQDGTITEEDSNSILPYINVDDHDVWIGEIVSLRSAEEKCDGLIHLKEVGVVQSVDAIERIARVKWFDGFVTSILEERPSTLITETSAGSLSDRESSVALFDIIAYPALTKRRGDLVVLAPFDSALTTSSPEEVSEALRTGKTPYVTSEGALENMQDLQDVLSRTSIRWFGEVVDLGLDGLLTIRLGALDQPEDIRVSVQRVSVAVGGDDYDSESEASSSNDYLSWSAAEEPEPISETVEYEGGQPIESGAEDDWMTDEAEDHSDADEEKDKVHVNGNIEVDGDVEMEDAPTELDAPAKVKPDNGHQMLETNAERANQNPPPLDSQALQPSTQYHFSRLSSMPTQFEILEGDAYAGHVFAGTISKFSATFLRRVRKEHAMLENNLPEGIWIKTWDDRLDLLRVLILGPRGTPYELAPFLLDFKLDDNFPASPPLVHFHSWTYGLGRINPNLYEDGKVCLSVLGTWDHNSANEGWNAAKSSLLQVIVSLLGLVLVENPYYNEAGFESLVGSDETIVPARIYREKALCMAKGFISYALSNEIGAVDSIMHWLYLDKEGPKLLQEVVAHSQELIARREIDPSLRQPGKEPLSIGAEMLLKRYLPALEMKLTKNNS